MSSTKPGAIWILAEHQDGRLADVSFELVSAGQDLAAKTGLNVEGLVLGQGIQDEDIRRLFRCGADRVFVVEDPLLEIYQSDSYLTVLHRLVEEHRPEIFLLGATGQGLDLAPCLAARLETGLSSHCIDLEIGEDGRLIQIVPAFGQNSVATIVCPEKNPQMATIRPGTFVIQEEPLELGEVIRLSAELDPDELRAVVLEHGKLPDSGETDLEAAEVVIAGGAGLGSEQGWDSVRELARVLGATIGATRPAVDNGWADLGCMIGHSGQQVHPKLYIGVGISGDMLHMIGMKDAHIAVAINNDPRAPIFEQVDYGIVGDYREILPLLVRALSNA